MRTRRSSQFKQIYAYILFDRKSSHSCIFRYWLLWSCKVESKKDKSVSWKSTETWTIPASFEMKKREWCDNDSDDQKERSNLHVVSEPSYMNKEVFRIVALITRRDTDCIIKQLFWITSKKPMRHWRKNQTEVCGTSTRKQGFMRSSNCRTNSSTNVTLCANWYHLWSWSLELYYK